MGKRSDFARRPHDAYQTIDPRAVRLLLPHLHGVRSFAEPCAGEGHLVRQLTEAGLCCTYSGDIQEGQDALGLSHADCGMPDAYITNPPWTRVLLHALVEHLMRLGPTWLLFDADWMHNTKRPIPSLLDHCSQIVSVGRLRWMEKSESSGKDNAAWYRFHIQHTGGPRFIPRPELDGGRYEYRRKA